MCSISCNNPPPKPQKASKKKHVKAKNSTVACSVNIEPDLRRPVKPSQFLMNLMDILLSPLVKKDMISALAVCFAAGVAVRQ